MRQILLVGDTVALVGAVLRFVLIRLMDFVEHAQASQPEPARA